MTLADAKFLNRFNKINFKGEEKQSGKDNNQKIKTKEADSVDGDYACILDPNAPQESGRRTSKANSDYKTIKDAINRPNNKVDQNNTDLYSMPLVITGKDKTFNENDEDEPKYIRVPEKKFDAAKIYDINKSSDPDRNNNNIKSSNNNNNNSHSNNKNSDYYYAAEVVDDTLNQKSSHYEVLPEYEDITHMEKDSKNISKLNINSNSNNYIRNINVVEENHYSNIDASQNIQYMDVNGSGIKVF